MKGIDLPAYSSLAKEFKYYAACVGLVDTGYFRKRSDPDAGDDTIYRLTQEHMEPNVEFVPETSVEDDQTSNTLENYRKWLRHYKAAIVLWPVLRRKPNYLLASLYTLQEDGSRS